MRKHLLRLVVAVWVETSGSLLAQTGSRVESSPTLPSLPAGAVSGVQLETYRKSLETFRIAIEGEREKQPANTATYRLRLDDYRDGIHRYRALSQPN